MSVRKKNAQSRMPLTRQCGTCGREFPTTADTPWVRQVPKDGKKQATVYYCSTGCFQRSYKHIGWYDGKAEERRKEKERKRDRSAYRQAYYAANAERFKEKARLYRAEHPESVRADNRYYRKKRKLREEKCTSILF